MEVQDKVVKEIIDKNFDQVLELLSLYIKEVLDQGKCPGPLASEELGNPVATFSNKANTISSKPLMQVSQGECDASEASSLKLQQRTNLGDVSVESGLCRGRPY